MKLSANNENISISLKPCIFSKQIKIKHNLIIHICHNYYFPVPFKNLYHVQDLALKKTPSSLSMCGKIKVVKKMLYYVAGTCDASDTMTDY